MPIPVTDDFCKREGGWRAWHWKWWVWGWGKMMMWCKRRNFAAEGGSDPAGSCWVPAMFSLHLCCSCWGLLPVLQWQWIICPLGWAEWEENRWLLLFAPAHTGVWELFILLLTLFSPVQLCLLLKCSLFPRLLLQQTKPEDSLKVLNPSSEHPNTFSPGDNPACQGCAQLLCPAPGCRKEQVTASSLLLPMQVSEIIQVQSLRDSSFSNGVSLP